MDLNDSERPIIAIFTNNGGRAIEQERAASILTVGQQYVVTSADVGGWCTFITLEGVVGSFNSCLFDVDWDQLEQMAFEHGTHVDSDIDT